MAYKALYRTYRPTRFEEVAGQQHIVKTLRNALATGKIAHAYLFAGPRGTGKTTMAKLLAKALNCDEGIGCQCNECKNCTAINDGTHPDVLELDAASNNGVDEIRELIDKVKYGAFLGRYKVYIIDEVHMLSAGAFNALLKTLEEPPSHVIFILATTEPHKILPTILSRCQRYDFSKVSEGDIRSRIQTVLEKEHIGYNEDAVNLIISLADGGMRDALSMLDQVLAYSGDQLNVEDVLEIFSLESTEEKINLIKSISRGDTSDVLKRLKKYIEKGTDIKRLTNDLLMILKDLLIYENSGSFDFSEVLKDNELMELNGYVEGNDINGMIDALMATLKDYKNVNDINPLFEVTLLKLCAKVTEKKEQAYREMSPLRYETPHSNGPGPEVIRRVQEMEKAKEEPKPEPVPEVKPEPAPVPQPEPEPEPVETINFDIPIDENIMYINGTEDGESFKVDDKLFIDIMVTCKKEDKDNLINNWKLLKRLTAHPALGKIAGMLLDGKPLVASNKILILEYNNATLVEKMNLIENQKTIQTIVKNAFGKKLFVHSVSHPKAVDLYQAYKNLYQIKKLPKADDVVIDFVGD